MNKKTIRVLRVAALGVPFVLASGAMAQMRSGADGHALDANNRLGSGGINHPNQGQGTVNGNDIVTGNVSGLSYFHGRVDYTDPRAFRGTLQGTNQSDILTRTVGQQPTADNPDRNTNPGARTSFYGDNRGVAPPANYQQIAPGQPGYVPAPQIGIRSTGDARLGAVLDPANLPLNQVNQPPLNALPNPGELVLNGPANKEGKESVIAASSLFGIRQTTPDDPLFQQQQQSMRDNPLSGAGLDPNTINRLRQELQAPEAGPNGANTPAAGPGASATPNGALPNRPLTDASVNTAVASGAVTSDVGSAPGAQNESLRMRLHLIPAQQQSAQYADMVRKLNEIQTNENTGDMEAAQAYNQAVQLREKMNQKPGAPGTPGALGTRQPGQLGTPPGGAAPGGASLQPGLNPPNSANNARPGAKAPGKKPAPLVVHSMAAGVTAKGLAELLKSAEDLMKQGKYNAASERYDAAQQVAPNNPLIPLGRSIAELGAGLYVRADTHVREAFSQNPALMMGQYDLRSMLGEDRLGQIVKELRELAGTEKRDPRPVFLLAFVSYNTTQEVAADGYLDQADKRAGGRDPFFANVRNHWTLPEKGPATAPSTPSQLNK